MYDQETRKHIRKGEKRLLVVGDSRTHEERQWNTAVLNVAQRERGHGRGWGT